jgi:hypothetical protein
MTGRLEVLTWSKTKMPGRIIQPLETYNVFCMAKLV